MNTKIETNPEPVVTDEMLDDVAGGSFFGDAYNWWGGFTSSHPTQAAVVNTAAFIYTPSAFASFFRFW